jgi:hypothetical protein
MALKLFARLRRRWRKAAKPVAAPPVQKQAPDAQPAAFLPDSPHGVDRFGRASFARTLSKALVLPPDSEGLVVGIEGTWGSGKTFVIRQITSVLEESPEHPIIVDFNPWVISGADSLVEALLEQISTAIGKDPEPNRTKEAVNAGASILSYLKLVRHLKYLKYVPGATAFGNVAEDAHDWLEKIGTEAKEGAEDLEEMKKQFRDNTLAVRKDAAIKALAELGRPIVVVLDDLDRLPPEEIRSVFRAVKAVANFPRTAYLLSYDPKIAAKALDADMNVGLTYLEKIVQVQYPLPAPLPWRVHAFARLQLEEALAYTKRVLSEGEQARFPEVVSYVARLSQTPRDIVRISNRLRISLPATEGEVDACDVILLEALGIREPQISEAIRQWPEDFTEGLIAEFEVFGQEFYFAQAAMRVGREKDDVSKELRWRQRISVPLSIYAEGILRHLFPDENGREPGTRRVRNPDRLYRFLALGPSEFITEIRDLNQLVSDASSLQAALEADDKSALSILRATRLYANELSIKDESKLIEALAAMANARLRKGGDWGELAHQYSRAIEAVLRRVAIGREQLAERVIDIAPLSVTQAFFVQAAKDLGEWPRSHEESESQRLIPDKAAFRRLISRWVTRVDRLFQAQADLKAEPLIYAALHRVGQLGGDYTLPRAITKTLVEGGDVLRFLRSTQLLGEGQLTYGNLDLVWSLPDLVGLLTRDSASADRYKEALQLLARDDVKDYFERRSTSPTTVWPPPEKKA